jgi:IclR helix-turn-helix domain
MPKPTKAVQPRKATPARQSAARSVERALKILLTVGKQGAGRGLGLLEIGREVGLHKSTAHRLVSVLMKEGFLQQDPETERYRLGLSALDVGSHYLENLTIRQHAAPHLSRLMAETNETVHLCILDDGEVVYIDKIESPGSVVVHTRIGGRQPAHCSAVGKAIFAYIYAMGGGGLDPLPWNAGEDAEDPQELYAVSRGAPRCAREWVCALPGRGDGVHQCGRCPRLRPSGASGRGDRDLRPSSTVA